MLYNNDFAVSAGASGAIFGLVGALVWIVIANRGFYEGISRQQAVFMVILMIYYGVSTQGVDNWAHGGGLAGGFVISIVLYRKKRYNTLRFLQVRKPVFVLSLSSPVCRTR